MDEQAPTPAGPTALATGYGLAVVGMPILTLGGGPTTREVVTAVVAVVLAALVAWTYRHWAGDDSRRVWIGPALVAVAALLYSVTPAGAATAIIALLVGAGAGLAAGRRAVPGTRGTVAAGAVAGAVTIAVLAVLPWPLGVTLAVVVAMSLVPPVAGLAVSLVPPVAGLAVRSGPGGVAAAPSVQPASGAGRAQGRGPRRALTGLAVAGAVGLLAWTAANDPQLSWFGPVTSNGPRDRPQVALTFDDGPNEPYSMDIARLLDERGVKGTFFLVGKAVDARPDVARQLLDDGQLLGNHSYHHDYWRWLDPRYPELGATQDAIERHVGVCPRFYRPPHGQRTPFITAQVAMRGMDTVTWDVSGGDWSTTDGELVARRILSKVEPGSIILLHDSIDGDPTVDRSVILEALPLILDGLQERGLDPVRLDEMLGGPAYLEDCG